MKLAHIALLALLPIGTLACHREAPKADKVAVAAPAVPAQVPATSVLASGKVLETMDASSYTYIHFKTDKEDIWAAGPTTKIAVGEKVSVTLDMPMADFHSTTLNRTFPTIYFTSHIFKEDELRAAPAAR